MLLLLLHRLRVAGLRGLQGVVHKTIADDLQCNILQPTHMNKIIPSLLVNLWHDSDAGSDKQHDAMLDRSTDKTMLHYALWQFHAQLPLAVTPLPPVDII